MKMTRATNLIPILAVLALPAAGCRDGTMPVRPGMDGPSADLFPVLTSNQDGPPADFRLTGGGRVDKQNHEPGKSPPGSHDFATFGFQARPNAPGTTDGSGKITWVEHNPNATPFGAFTFHGQVNRFSKPTDETRDDPNCGRFRGQGILRTRTLVTVTVEFTAKHACDKGEPGRQDHIKMKINIPANDRFQSEDGDGFYERHGLLTGGNIQQHPL